MELCKDLDIVNTNVSLVNYQLPTDEVGVRLLMEVLTSRMYTNKLTAVIREIFTNAVDANVEAGRPNHPIDITLPAIIPLEPQSNQLIIRDYGIGISPERAPGFFTFMTSTKRDDNIQCGGYGLGSKSPYAIASQFTVTTIHNGIEYIYACSLNNGMPTAALLNSRPSNDSSGTRVAIPIVEQHNRRQCYNEVMSIVMWSRAVTNIYNPEDTGGETTRRLLDYRNDYDYEYGAPGPFISKAFCKRKYTQLCFTIGGIPYTISDSKVFDIITAYLKEQGYSIRNIYNNVNTNWEQTYNLVDSIIIPVPIGYLELPPQRETLAWSESNIEKLKELSLNAIKSLVDRRQAEIEACDSLTKATGVIDKWYLGDKYFTWRGTRYCNVKINVMDEPAEPVDNTILPIHFIVKSSRNLRLIGCSEDMNEGKWYSTYRVLRNIRRYNSRVPNSLNANTCVVCKTNNVIESMAYSITLEDIQRVALVVTRGHYNARSIRATTGIPNYTPILWIDVTECEDWADILSNTDLEERAHTTWPYIRFFQSVTGLIKPIKPLKLKKQDQDQEQEGQKVDSLRVSDLRGIRIVNKSYISRYAKDIYNHLSVVDYRDLPTKAVYCVSHTHCGVYTYWNYADDSSNLYYLTPRQAEIIAVHYPEWRDIDTWARDKHDELAAKYGADNLYLSRTTAWPLSDIQTFIRTYPYPEHFNKNVRALIDDGYWMFMQHLIDNGLIAADGDATKRLYESAGSNRCIVWLKYLLGDYYDACAFLEYAKSQVVDTNTIMPLISAYYKVQGNSLGGPSPLDQVVA